MNNLSKVAILLAILIFCYGYELLKNGLFQIAIMRWLSRLSELKGCNLEWRKSFQKDISQDLMCALQNGFHHEKGHILFLKLGISALGHQIPRLVTIMHKVYIFTNTESRGSKRLSSQWIRISNVFLLLRRYLVGHPPRIQTHMT